MNGTSNQRAWERPDVVGSCVRDTALQPPEQTILDLLGGCLSEMNMLDIGVGVGRTTNHFANRVKEYVGIDYSEKMIAECKTIYSGYRGNISFYVCDARSMDMFEDNEFDLILFSFNGLDYISHSDRLEALKEINRVGKLGSLFCFSTHNLSYTKHLFGLWHQITWRPRTMRKRFSKWFALSFVHNKPLDVIKTINGSSYAIINDGAYGYSLLTYYIDPLAQIEQLNNLFENVRVFLCDGSEVKKVEQESKDDWWIYYLAENV